MINNAIDSRIAGFRAMDPSDRLQELAAATGLGDAELSRLKGGGILPLTAANGMIENVVGTFELPLGIATNFLINGRDHLIPMAVEEPSVVAAASYMAKLARAHGGFQTSSTDPIMRAQVQLLDIAEAGAAKETLLENRDEILALANEKDHVLLELGGGCRDIEVHVFEETPVGAMVILHLLVDVRDAMGANTVNTMAESVAPLAEKLTGGTARLRILSNLADRRLARARVALKTETLATEAFSGERIARGIVEACAFAIVDPYRAATHNKGIMNGIDPLVVVTGNDWRAIEAGAHAWAARSGRYTALSRWEMEGDDTLVGTLEMPMALGLVGGATKTHPGARAALALLGVESAQELAEVAVALGLAQNMAALRALASEGIQRGHMTLHARNIAITAGANGNQIDAVAAELVAVGDISVDAAKAILHRIIRS